MNLLYSALYLYLAGFTVRFYLFYVELLLVPRGFQYSGILLGEKLQRVSVRLRIYISRLRNANNRLNHSTFPLLGTASIHLPDHLHESRDLGNCKMQVTRSPGPLNGKSRLVGHLPGFSPILFKDHTQLFTSQTHHIPYP